MREWSEIVKHIYFENFCCRKISDFFQFANKKTRCSGPKHRATTSIPSFYYLFNNIFGMEFKRANRTFIEAIWRCDVWIVNCEFIPEVYRKSVYFHASAHSYFIDLEFRKNAGCKHSNLDCEFEKIHRRIWFYESNWLEKNWKSFQIQPKKCLLAPSVNRLWLSKFGTMLNVFRRWLVRNSLLRSSSRQYSRPYKLCS